MTQRTCNIIMCCKGNSKYSNKGDSIYSIKRYMGDECIYNWENYTDAMIQDILYTALMDYIDGVKKPSFVLWCLKNDGRLHDHALCFLHRGLADQNQCQDSQFL